MTHRRGEIRVEREREITVAIEADVNHGEIAQGGSAAAAREETREKARKAKSIYRV